MCKQFLFILLCVISDSCCCFKEQSPILWLIKVCSILLISISFIVLIQFKKNNKKKTLTLNAFGFFFFVLQSVSFSSSSSFFQPASGLNGLTSSALVLCEGLTFAGTL